MEQLKKLRKERGLNQAAIAQVLNISVSAYGNYELDQREPNIESLKKLADFYNVSVDYIIGRDLHPSSYNNLTEEDKQNGATISSPYNNFSEADIEWFELKSEILEAHSEEYLQTVIKLIRALISQQK